MHVSVAERNLRVCVLAEVAGDGLTFRLRQRREPSLADKPLHLWQDFLPFRHGPEPWVWHPMARCMWRSVASSATPCVYLSIGSIEVWNTGKNRAACAAHSSARMTVTGLSMRRAEAIVASSLIKLCRFPTLLSAQSAVSDRRNRLLHRIWSTGLHALP